MLSTHVPSGIFIVPRLVKHTASVFAVSSTGLPHSVAFCDKQGVLRTDFLEMYQMMIRYDAIFYLYVPPCNKYKSFLYANFCNNHVIAGETGQI